MTHLKLILLVFSTFIFASAAATTATATVIVQDTFTRTGALIGSVSDSGHTWGGSAATSNANGSQLAVVGSVASFATISGLSILPNAVHTLSAEIVLTAGGSQWLGIGFSRPTSTNAVNNTNGFMLRRHSPDVETFVTGSSSTAVSFSVANTFPDTLEVELTTGATLADSFLTWRLNGVALRSDEPVDATGLDGIFLGNVSPFFGANAVGTYDNVTLDVTPVPEPGTALLIGMGLAILGGKRRGDR